MQEEGFPESPAMSFDFRIKLFALCMGNILVMMLWQKVTPEPIFQCVLHCMADCIGRLLADQWLLHITACQVCL